MNDNGINDKLSKVLDVVIESLGTVGVEIDSFDHNDESPVFNVCIDGDNENYEESDVLNYTYRLLWTLVNGKVTDDNRDNKIVLNYRYKEGPANAWSR